MILRAAIVATSLILMPVQAEDTPPSGDTRTATIPLAKLRTLLDALRAQELRIEELEWAIEKLKAQKDCA